MNASIAEEASTPEIQYLSYSGYKCYIHCPLDYWHRYVNNTPYNIDPRESLFGSIIGKVFEWFYDRNMWQTADPTSAALSVQKEAILTIFAEDQFVPDPDGKDDELLRKIQRNLAYYVPLGVENIRKHKLLSTSTRTEVKLHITYKSNIHDFAIRMGGYADFIHGMEHPWIIDGKAGSKENVDNFQLIWYATQFYLRYHKAPERLGFLFWMSPDDPLQWVDYEEHDIRYCVKETYRVAQSIRLKMFDPKPSKKCPYCPFLGQCNSGSEYLEAMKMESKVRINTEESIFQMDDV